MAGNESSKLHIENNNGVPHTLSEKATFDNALSKKRSSSHVRIRRNVPDHSSNETTRCFEGSSSISKLSFPHVFSTKERRFISAHIQPKIVESICADRSFSINKHVPGSRVSSISRLDVQGGPITGIFPSTDSSVTQAISAPPIQRPVARNDLSSVRVEYITENFRMPHELDSPDSPRKRSKNNCVPRRFSHCTSTFECCGRSCKVAFRNPGVPRVSSKLPKICSHPTKTNHIPRYYLAHLGKPQKTTSRKGCCCSQESLSYIRYKKYYSENAAESGRTVQFCQLCCPPRQIKPSRNSSILKHTTRERNVDKLQSASLSAGGNALVASKLSSFNLDTHTTTNTLFNHRCLRYGMGSTAQQPSHIGYVEPGGTVSALQSEGIISHSKSPRDLRSKYVRKFNSDSVRQSISRSLSSKRGRDQISIADEHYSPNPSSPRQLSDSVQNLPHFRKVQQSCGLPIQTPSCSRMAFDTELHGNDFCDYGNPRDRLICIQNRSSPSKLRNIRSQRSRSNVSRCVQRELELPTCMDFPPAVSDSASIDAPQQCNRNLSNRSPTMGKSILAGGSEITGHCSPLHPDESQTIFSRHNHGDATSQSPRHDSGNLEMWGWTDKIKSWDSNQIALLKASWRPSTWKTYKAPWNRWVSWAKQHKINPVQPQGSELAQFLADLYLKFKFSYNTILLHKSVISTLCNAELSGKLSEDVLVRHILKSISLKKPKVSKPPIWDINILTNFMGNYYVDCTNIFQTVRHTAALLSLCSGRRIHDLTLLSVDSEHCTIKDDFIVLWPQFGSKTDCRDYRQSGWKLLVNTQNQNLDPVFWINKTISVLSERRSNSESSNLFISLRGAPSPASRTTIAGWFKSLMKLAGIIATPGSIRSAVASRNWIDNFPLDDILARGNWKTVKTFQKFYCREVMVSSRNINNTSSTITSLFNPVR